MSDTMKSQVCGVVISYKPSPDLLNTIQLALSQLAHVIIVDNTPTEESPDVLNRLGQQQASTIIRNMRNLGVASALNIGMRQALKMGFLWVITLDQDSWMRDGYVEEMLSTYRKAAERTCVGMLCPRYQDARLGRVDAAPRAMNGEVSICITSGAMIRSETFDLLGPMEDDFFIDSVDHEYCLRMRQAGLKIIECPRAILVHSLGRITEHALLGRNFPTSNHSARRRYYITRNRLVLMRRYFSKDREWTVTEFKRMVMETAIVFLFERARLSKAKFMMLGFWDAVFNLLGPRVSL